MDHQAIRQQLPEWVAGHLPRNASSFKYTIYDGQPATSALGFRVDPKPFEGKVIATTDEAIILKVGRTQFAVLDRTLVTVSPPKGTTVSVQPYARRRFDGLRADTPETVEQRRADGISYTVQRVLLGVAPAPLPVTVPECPELQQLIKQLESMPAPDGHRTITHMLVDAMACDFSIVDPAPKDLIRTPPAISFNVQTGKFQGRVSVLYMRGDDVYAIELSSAGECIERRDQVYFDMLGETLADLIDDGSWRCIHVQPAPLHNAATTH